MKVIMLACEALPFVKVGGLSDVVYSLSQELTKKKVSTSIVLPYFKSIKENNLYKSKITFFKSFKVKMSWRTQIADIYKVKIGKVNYYLVGNNYYFNRDKVYNYDDDLERFSFFSLASYELISKILKNIDIVHIHDWHCSIVPLIYRHFSKKKEIRFMLTIHNPCFQGKCQPSDLYNYFNLPEYYFENGLTRFDNQVNLLKTAIMLSDRITTVSNTHKSEILNGISSYGLDRVLCLRNSDFSGILNGLDYGEFNPETDPYIYQKYNIKNVFEMKKINKELLCKEFNFEHPEYPLFCVVSRLSKQKGIEFLIANIEKILSYKMNLIILGTGDKEYENQLAFYCSNFNNASCNIKFSNELAHKIYGASDFLLMPSIYEPCGISQMIAMTYGTIPIASKVGGLVDTVISYNEVNDDCANGILFNIDSDHLLLSIILAIHLYNDKKDVVQKLIINGMKKNFSWEKACNEYYRLYSEMIQAKNALK